MPFPLVARASPAAGRAAHRSPAAIPSFLSSPSTPSTRRVVAPRNRRAPFPSSSVAIAAALASDVDEDFEEDATPSDGEVVSTSSPLLPSGRGQPAIAGALPAASTLFSGLKVLVVGATGRTGRLIVSRLVAEGVPVRCLVRDVSKARAVLPEASSSPGLVTLVRGDLTQPASLPPALAEGVNAVVWAAGVPSLVAMLKDPLAPLRVEAEGVANLVAVFERLAAAEKNSSPSSSGTSPPRFVLISSIGADSVVAQLAFPGGVLFW